MNNNSIRYFSLNAHNQTMEQLKEVLNPAGVGKAGDGECCKIFHGPKGQLPGWESLLVDKLGEHIFILTYKALEKKVQQALITHLRALYPGCTLRLQYRGGGGFQDLYITEGAPEHLRIRENGLNYIIHTRRGMNPGFFPDMKAGRNAVAQWLKSKANSPLKEEPGLKVLNLFAFTCSFSVVALKAGASHVDNWDMNRNSLNIGKENHGINGLGEDFSCFPHNIFKSFSKIRRRGPYAFIIMDPPPRQVGSFLWKKDYPRLIQRLPSFLAEGGAVLFCLNASDCSRAEFYALIKENLEGTFQEYEEIPCPEEYLSRYPDRGLKTILARGYSYR